MAMESQTNGAPTLSTLRMKAGLSQSALATRMGTQQPNIARWERSPTGIQAETIIKLAKALEVDSGSVFAAIASQIAMHEQQS